METSDRTSMDMILQTLYERFKEPPHNVRKYPPTAAAPSP